MANVQFLDIDGLDDRNTGKDKHDVYIKSDVNMDCGYEFAKLSAFQRYILAGLTRVRARTGKPVPNDAVYIGHVLQVLPRERAHVARAIKALTAAGLVVEVTRD